MVQSKCVGGGVYAYELHETVECAKAAEQPAYLIVPGVIFHIVFSIWVPPRQFQRTRTEELTAVALRCVFPFLLALVLVWYTPLGRFPNFFNDSPELKKQDYKLIFDLHRSDNEKEASASDEWDAFGRVGQRQFRFLTFFYLFVGLEALFIGTLLDRHAEYKVGDPRKAIAARLLRNISDWHSTLTPFTYPRKDRDRVQIWGNILTTDDQLYKGRVNSYSEMPDGQITSITLTFASRFDRITYLRDKQEGKTPLPDAYWKTIPGELLLVPFEKIVSLNIVHLDPSEQNASAVSATVNEELELVS
jgi:hypothetical protein